jgi:Fur family iron response transcriptional regulator
MKHVDVVRVLEEHGIQPSAQRVAVGRYVLQSDEHPSADRVFQRVTAAFPMISRATVYNTLNLFVKKGLLHELVLAEGRSVFDPNVEKHHHFIDDESGAIADLPWDALEVKKVEKLRGIDVREYQVVVRGKKKRSANP